MKVRLGKEVPNNKILALVEKKIYFYIELGGVQSLSWRKRSNYRNRQLFFLSIF